MSKSVLLIAPQPFFVNRGTPMNVRAMVETLAHAGYKVTLLVYPFGDEIDLPGVELIRSRRVPGVNSIGIGPSKNKLLLDIPLGLKALQLGLTRRFDAFHGVEEGALIAGVIALLRRKPYIYDMDSCMTEQLLERRILRGGTFTTIFRNLESFFLRRAGAVLTVCAALTEKVRAIDSNIPIHQVEDFPTDSDAEVSANRIQALRKQHSIPSGTKVFVYTGNFENYQGINLLLRAFAELKQFERASSGAPGEQREQPADSAEPRPTIPPSKLILVGGGELRGAGVVLKQRLVDELWLGDNVIFTGNRPGAEIPDYLALADVLVSPRIEGENTPLKIYGYMAAGKPIVATNIRSHTQVLDDNSAFLAPLDPALFAQVMLKSIAPEFAAEQQRRAHNAQELVQARYSRAAFEARLCELYAAVVGEPQRPVLPVKPKRQAKLA